MFKNKLLFKLSHYPKSRGNAAAVDGGLVLPEPLESFRRQLRTQHTNVYWCPLDLQRSTSSSRPLGSTNTYKTLFQGRRNKLGSFICNGAVSGFGTLNGYDKPNTFKVSRFKPTNYLLWEPNEEMLFWFNDGSSYPNEGFSRRHNIGATLGAVGGHVDYVKYDKWLRLLRSPPYPNDFYWSPASPTGQ